MVTLRPISLDCVSAYKAVRLRALQDTPLAFGSTFEKESQLTDAEWELRVLTWNGLRSICNLAWDNACGVQACGIAAGYLDAEIAGRAHLVSMWVAPTHRRRGVGRLLVESVVDWARKQDATTLTLTAVSSNETAIRFYERLGFAKTGRTEPYPNDPALVEYEMSRKLD